MRLFITKQMPFYSIEQTTFVYSLNILYFNNKARIAVILAATKSRGIDDFLAIFLMLRKQRKCRPM